MLARIRDRMVRTVRENWRLAHGLLFLLGWVGLACTALAMHAFARLVARLIKG